MKMEQFFKKKMQFNILIIRVLVAFMVAGLMLSVIPDAGGMTVYAENTTEPDPAQWATALASSTSGKTLNTGFYYVKPGTEVSCTNSSTGGNGITISANATVYIYIPEGSKLIAKGASGSGRTTGGGAGIYVPSTATLVFLGNGEVEATGGKAASGSGGNQGGSASRNSSADTFTTGTGGTGGAGGAGAGAGIGTKGGNGGSGGSGGSGYTVDKDKQTNGANGSSGNSGSSGASMGKVYKSEGITVTATGGAAGSSGSGGSAGSTSGAYKWGDPYRGAAGGAGGGGGGGGYAGAAIGTGGTGGSGGGGGAGAGYNWCGYYCGGGGGGGGAGGNGGYGGTRGSVSYLGSWGGNSTRNATLVYTASSGSTGGTTSGGGGGGYSQLRCTANDGTKTNGYSGSGGTGGSRIYSSSTAGSITVISAATESKYYKYNVTFEGADENGQQYYYTGKKASDGNTVIAPGYTAEENQHFIGWKVKTNGYAFRFNDDAAVEEEAALLWDDETFYQKGAVIKIASDTYGPVVLEPIVVASAGDKAVSEVLAIEPAEYENPTTYLTYQVETLVNGVRKDVGQIALVKDEETYLISSGSGENRGLYQYTLSATVPIEDAPVFSVHVKGEDTGIDVSADTIAQISYKEMQVITRLNGEVSDQPGMVTLADGDALVLTKQSVGTYSYVALEKDIETGREYSVLVDGMDSGQAVSFGDTEYIDYSSVQIDIEGNVQVSNVILRNEEARVSIPLEYQDGVWSTIQQVDELTYTVYVNGVKTDYNTVKFDGNAHVLELGVYKTRFITRKDNVVSDDLVNDIYLGTHLAQRVGVGTYEVIYVMNPEADSDALTYYVNSAYGMQEAVAVLGEEVVLDYYTVSYDGGSVHTVNVPVDNHVYLKGTELALASNEDMSNLGKAFAGWLVEDTIYASGDVLIVNNTVQPIAQWESVKYKITYVMNDSGADGAESEAVNPNASLVFYTVDDSIILENPTREECTFIGWTYERISADTSTENTDEGDSELNPVKDLNIPAGYTGDITFEAHWLVHQYNIDVDVTEYDFGSRVEGYDSSTLPEAVTVTVTNVGNQPVDLSSVASNPVDETITQSAFLCSGLSETSLAVGETATFTIRPKTGVALGEYEETVTVKTTKGTEAYVNVKFLVGKDVTPPVMTVNVGTDSWSDFAESISSADMKKYGQATTVTIDATDAESPMGSVQYYLATESMTQAQLENLRDTDWQIYTAPFTITDNKQFILYARAYDAEEPANVAWVSTDILEIDTIAPVIKGVQTGTYYGSTKFTVEDTNLDTVTLDGIELTSDANGVYTLPVDKGVKKNLAATDIHGYVTTMEVTVNNIKYDVSYDANGGAGIMAMNTIESGDSFVLPAVKFTAPDSKMIFAYWTILGDQSNTVYAVGSNYTVTGAVTFVANWNYKEYSIAYDLRGGEFAEGVNIPSSYTGIDAAFAIPTPNRFGYDFAGWTWEGQTTPVTNVTIETGSGESYKFTANWTESTEAKYVVRHWLMEVNANAGVDEYELKNEVAYVGEHATSVTPDVAVYAGFTSPTPITLTLDAKQEAVVDYYYTRNTYQMDMVVNNVTMESVRGVYGSAQSAVVANAAGYGPLSLVGIYDFAGNPLADTSEVAFAINSLDGADSITALIPAQNIKIVLGRAPIEYSITYDLDGGEVLIGINPGSYTVVTEAFCLTAPEKAGYEFVGWTWPGQETPVKEVLVDTSSTGNLNYQANWAQIEEGVSQAEYIVNHYLQNLDGTYTLVESECCYDEIDNVVTPSRRSYLGYITPEEITVTVSAENTDDVNYYYNRQSYTLTWNLGVGVSGININPEMLDADLDTEGIQVYYGAPVEATAILENGYLSALLTGYGESGINKKSFTMPAQDVCITATATLRVYALTYQLAGGSFTEATKAEYNVTEADYTVPVPVRTGYTFDGWTVIVNGASTDGTVTYTVDTEMCADIILNARWTADEAAYTVKHCKENTDGTGYAEVLADRECSTATVGTVLTPAVKTYTGYVSPATISVTVLADGSTEVVYYYDLVEYAVENDKQNAGSLEDIRGKLDEITDVIEGIEDSYTDINNQIADNNVEIEENRNQIAENNTQIETNNDRITEIDELLQNETLPEEERDSLETEGSGLESENEQLSAENTVLENNIVNLESINEALEYQKQAGLDANEEYVYFKGKKVELEALIEAITQTQDDFSEICDELENSDINPALSDVTSDDKQNLQALVESIDTLLDAEQTYLSEEEKNELLDKRAELIRKLQQIEETEKSILEVEERIQYLPSMEEVNSEDEAILSDLAESIDELLQSTNLTQEERAELLAEKESIREKSDKITEVKNGLDNLQLRDDAVDKENVNSNDRDTIETLIRDLQQILDENENNMTEAEKQDVKNRIFGLQDELNNLEQIRDDLDEVETKFDNMHPRDYLVTDDRYVIDDLVDEIDILLSNNSDHMTDAEKNALNEKREELLEMLEEIERIQNTIDDVFNKDAEVDIMENVSSKDLEVIQEAQTVINDLLQNESNHLTDDQKQALQETLIVLNEKQEIIEEYAELIEDAKELADELTVVEEIKEVDRAAIEETIGKLEELLETGHLSDAERIELSELAEEAQEKLDRLDAAEDAKEAMDTSYAEAALPGADEVKTDDLESVEELYEQLQDMLENYSGNMSSEEIAEYEELSDALQDMLENITRVKEVLELVETNYPNVPADDELSTNDMEFIEQIEAEIRDVLDNYTDNLSEEQKSEFESKLTVLENKKAIIQNATDKLDNIDQMVGQLPEMDIVTSDNKGEMENLISDIEEMLSMEPCVLTEEEKESLIALKRELQDALDKLEEVEGEISNLQEAAGNAPSVEEVKTTDKEELEQLVEDIDRMLAENGNHMSDEEKASLEQRKEELQVTIDKAEEVEGEISNLQEAAGNAPSVDEVKTTDKEELEQLVEDIDRMLAENGNHMSDEERNTLENLKDELLEKLDSIEVLEQEMSEVIQATAQIPEKADLKTSDKADVNDAITLVDSFINDCGMRLSQEELMQLTDEKAALEEKAEHIENLIREEARKAALRAEIATETESINNAFAAVNNLENPGENEILLMQQLIERIDQFIANKGENLSQEERNHLASVKSLLQNKIDTAYEQNRNTGTNDSDGNDTGNTSDGQDGENIPSDSDTSEEEGTGQGDEDVTVGDDTSEEEDNKEGTGNGTYTVEIYSGQKLVAQITGLKAGEELALAEIPDGIYTIVTTNGKQIDTSMLIMKDGESNIDAVKGVGNKETEVQFTEEEYRMAVEGLEQIYAIPELSEKIEGALAEGGSCTIRFVIREPKKTSGMDEMENRAKKEEHKLARMFDFSVAAHIYAADGKETVMPITDTEYLLLTAIPLEEFEKGKAKYYVYRSHEWEEGKGEVVELLPELVGKEKLNPTGEGFYVDGDYVYIWASKYSTYALAYDDEYATKHCGIWCWLWILLVVLVSAKLYHDYRKKRNENKK